MGERAGYRCREGKETSQICRKQWFLGGDRHSLEYVVKHMAEVLMDGHLEDTEGIGGGMVALRDDLGINRLFPALVKTVCDGGFDSIHADTNCDIGDHGLFEIEIKKWNVWMINHYEVEWRYPNPNHGKCLDKEVLGAAIFEKGKPFTKGIHFEWIKEPDF